MCLLHTVSETILNGLTRVLLLFFHKNLTDSCGRKVVAPLSVAGHFVVSVSASEWTGCKDVALSVLELEECIVDSSTLLCYDSLD